MILIISTSNSFILQIQKMRLNDVKWFVQGRCQLRAEQAWNQICEFSILPPSTFPQYLPQLAFRWSVRGKRNRWSRKLTKRQLQVIKLSKLVSSGWTVFLCTGEELLLITSVFFMLGQGQELERDFIRRSPFHIWSFDLQEGCYPPGLGGRGRGHGGQDLDHI